MPPSWAAFAAGAAAVAARASGRAVDLIVLDTSRPGRPRARPLADALARIVRARAINPRFIAGQMRHGPRGAAEFAETVTRLVDFAQTTGAVGETLIDLVYDAYLVDPTVREFLLRTNPAAARNIADCLTTARRHGWWHPRRNDVDADLQVPRGGGCGMSGRRNACPGLSAPMPTGDGLLVRFTPAGPIGTDTFIALCAAAQRHGNGTIEITARGSVQVRGLSERSAEEFAAAVAALGIAANGVPVIATPLDDDPEAVIAAGPLAAELRLAIGDLDLALAGQGLTLAPKTSVVVDGGGRLHLDALTADIRLRATAASDGPRFAVGIAGDGASATWLGVVTPDEVCAVVVTLLTAIAALGPTARARDLLGVKGDAASARWEAVAIGSGRNPSREGRGWSTEGRPGGEATVHEINCAAPPPGLAPLGHPPPSGEGLRGGPVGGCAADLSDVPRMRGMSLPPSARRECADDTDAGMPVSNSVAEETTWLPTFVAPPPRPPAEPVGLHRLRDDRIALGVALAFGHADADRLARLIAIAADHGAAALRPAAGRALLIVGVAPDHAIALAEAVARFGFITSHDDPRRRIVACPGAPICSSGRMPTRQLAATLAAMLSDRFHQTDHMNGCADPPKLSFRSAVRGPQKIAQHFFGVPRSGLPDLTASPESTTAAGGSAPWAGAMDFGFSAVGPWPTASPRNDPEYELDDGNNPLAIDAGVPAVIHLSGCHKGCAHPGPAAITVVGTEHGCGIIRSGSAGAEPPRFVAPADVVGAVVAEVACADRPAYASKIACGVASSAAIASPPAELTSAATSPGEAAHG